MSQPDSEKGCCGIIVVVALIVVIIAIMINGCDQESGAWCIWDFQCGSEGSPHFLSDESYVDLICAGGSFISTCSRGRNEGETCREDSECNDPAVCNNALFECRSPGVAGERCAESQDCAEGVICNLRSDPSVCVRPEDIGISRGNLEIDAGENEREDSGMQDATIIDQ